MDSDDQYENTRQYSTLSMGQTMTAPLNNTTDFFGLDNDLGQTTLGYEQLLDEPTRDLLKYGFRKAAKKNEFIRVHEIGDAFRHSGQNPAEDTVKDMIDKANKLKASYPREDEDEKVDDRLSFADFLTVVHEYWIPIEDDKQQLQEAFDILDPETKSKLMVDEFVYLLKNCDWPEEDIDLLLSQVNCADGYFLHDDLQRILLTPVDTGKKKSSKGKKKGK